MVKKIKVVLVSYMNSWPFLFGLYKYSQLNNRIDIQIEYPSLCTQRLLQGEAQIGLIPVGSLPLFNRYFLVSNYCIGTNREVASVLLVGDKPLKDMKAIYLDYQSETSNRLAYILAKEYWQISPRWLRSDRKYEKKIKGNIGGIVIGDRAFSERKKHIFSYDLAKHWYEYTGLPFVFAVWISTEPMDTEFLTLFNSALNYGVNNISATLEYFSKKLETNFSEVDAKFYLEHYIDYKFDEKKVEAMNLFLKKISHYETNF